MGCCNSGCGCGSSGSDGLLKFSGTVATDAQGGQQASYLADAGTSFTSITTAQPVNYPIPIQRTLQNLAVNIGALTLSPGQTIFVQLLKNGVAIPGFNVTYGSGDSGVKVNDSTGRVTLAVGAVFELQTITIGFSGSDIPMTAAIGVV